MNPIRSFSPRHASTIAVVWLACTAGISTAWAAPSPGDPPPRTGADDEAAYRKAIRDGVAEYEAGHYEEARSLFRRAHALAPSARTYRGIGMTSFEVRDYVAAARNLSAALQDKRKPLTLDQRRETQDLLDRSRQFIDVYTVKVVPGHARLVVDGHASEFEPDGTLFLGFGGHSIEASAPDLMPARVSIEVRGGERKNLVLSLSPPPPRPPGMRPTGPVATASASTSLPPRSPHAAASAWLWSAAGLALLAGGGGYYWYRQQAELDACRHPAVGLRCTTERTLVYQRNVAIGVAAGLGALALTSAAIGLIKWQSTPVRKTALGCAVSPYGMACGGTF